MNSAIACIPKDSPRVNTHLTACRSSYREWINMDRFLQLQTSSLSLAGSLCKHEMQDWNINAIYIYLQQKNELASSSCAIWGTQYIFAERNLMQVPPVFSPTFYPLNKSKCPEYQLNYWMQSWYQNITRIVSVRNGYWSLGAQLSLTCFQPQLLSSLLLYTIQYFSFHLRYVC